MLQSTLTSTELRHNNVTKRNVSSSWQMLSRENSHMVHSSHLIHLPYPVAPIHSHTLPLRLYKQFKAPTWIEWKASTLTLLPLAIEQRSGSL